MELEHLQPQLFKEFNQILKSDRMNHAYLFSGDFASFDFALYLAKSRFCENLQDGLPCGECRECQLIAENEFSDVKIVKPSGQVIKTDTIRELMRDFSRSGFEGKSQVFIIQDCEKMHVNAANSLLKFIEEPQSSSYMILLTSDENKVLPTIKSRTQIFRFPKNKPLLIEQAEKAGVLKTQAEILAELAKTPKHLDELMQDKKILDVIQTCERFVTVLFKEKKLAYLETGRLVQVALEKSDQELVFQLLPLFLAKQFNQKESLVYLEKSYKAQQMWKSNVSFQNALEYMVIS
ncbi:DNA polymerase III subunit delta' [Streptococcus gallolyticus subsp. gallolyticus]|uniref:DNA polymerase III subunit delta' n=1 Tax=Streptococcus gallolyticus TaxID=315405 RepID=UPI002000893D|nr:DNA polymerase III subunit delta' [Streptococcus gallolyticus]MCY7155836.1 DNA polymerase III subunit delta' [Streptococcus gallolyticus subsp. gallolyticus]MCY7173374.1 DNA polymerase III subunit delta' [Streptococcus gallolyticus subsp. gallolyticus]MCY7175496.1 DNA polymerase III subunit delta' [Streptococcus gallolyticus subsp. gallolyticus]MCY7179951.1 DNA polymerase III subunit delta' [Streptococcus gallolyticus subsp. gallolyticus]MCY7197502.1 DNA polymerase III subunit delta' [Strep